MAAQPAQGPCTAAAARRSSPVEDGLSSWTTEQLAAWAAEVPGCRAEWVALFTEAGWTGKHLAQATDGDLAQLGFRRISERRYWQRARDRAARAEGGPLRRFSSAGSSRRWSKSPPFPPAPAAAGAAACLFAPAPITADAGLPSGSPAAGELLSSPAAEAGPLSSPAAAAAAVSGGGGPASPPVIPRLALGALKSPSSSTGEPPRVTPRGVGQSVAMVASGQMAAAMARSLGERSAGDRSPRSSRCDSARTRSPPVSPRPNWTRSSAPRPTQPPHRCATRQPARSRAPWRPPPRGGSSAPRERPAPAAPPPAAAGARAAAAGSAVQRSAAGSDSGGEVPEWSPTAWAAAARRGEAALAAMRQAAQAALAPRCGREAGAQPDAAAPGGVLAAFAAAEAAPPAEVPFGATVCTGGDPYADWHRALQKLRGSVDSMRQVLHAGLRSAEAPEAAPAIQRHMQETEACEQILQGCEHDFEAAAECGAALSPADVAQKLAAYAAVWETHPFLQVGEGE
eukprot:TRINITY_DN14839_c0_g1_i5.p1 TRINITY_DN14839_c0_g1~~TRINITY_DN14839_c0_g1_i5.p1  ORF type:complete len:538 (+),score=106.31 TRINITY_DN14839_c0_g1_i5:80-1615(+)